MNVGQKIIYWGQSISWKIVVFIFGLVIGSVVPETIRFASVVFDGISFVAGNWAHSKLYRSDCMTSYFVNASKYDAALEVIETTNDRSTFDDALNDLENAYEELRHVYSWCSGVSASDAIDRERLEYIENILYYNTIATNLDEEVTLDKNIISMARSECQNLYKHLSSNRVKLASGSSNIAPKFNDFAHVNRAREYPNISNICIGLDIEQLDKLELYKREHLKHIDIKGTNLGTLLR